MLYGITFDNKNLARRLLLISFFSPSPFEGEKKEIKPGEMGRQRAARINIFSIGWEQSLYMP